MRPSLVVLVFSCSGCFFSLDAPDANGSGTCPSGAATTPCSADARITDDADDAMWVKRDGVPPNERLSYSTDKRVLFVGDDMEHECTGLRFRLNLPKGAAVTAATLSLTRNSGNNLKTDTILLQTWSSATLAAFHQDASELPANHDPSGIWGDGVTWAPGTENTRVTSPDLAALIGHDLSLDAYQPGGHVGLLLSKDSIVDRYVGFDDSSGGTAAELEITYRVP